MGLLWSPERMSAPSAMLAPRWLSMKKPALCTAQKAIPARKPSISPSSVSLHSRRASLPPASRVIAAERPASGAMPSATTGCRGRYSARTRIRRICPVTTDAPKKGATRTSMKSLGMPRRIAVR